MAITISKKTLTEQVNAGMKKDQLAAHYDLPEAQISKLLKAAGLKIRSFRKPLFVLEDDLAEENTTEVERGCQVDAPVFPSNGVSVESGAEVAAEEVVETTEVVEAAEEAQIPQPQDEAPAPVTDGLWH